VRKFSGVEQLFPTQPGVGHGALDAERCNGGFLPDAIANPEEARPIVSPKQYDELGVRVRSRGRRVLDIDIGSARAKLIEKIAHVLSL
jgi:hypothetical protein